MTGDRRKFRREGEERRREALITAALELIAEGGPAAATVRAIAERAGVTPGLIRHYFQSKDDLTRAAYRALMQRMNTDNAAVLESAPGSGVAACGLRRGSIAPPVVDPGRMGLWAGFMHQVRKTPKWPRFTPKPIWATATCSRG
ncbi:TetR/AcrR family transcriptional regulator [Gemmobacter lanyuensis]